MTDKTLYAYINEYGNLTASIKELEKKAKEKRQKIIDGMKERNAPEIITGKYKAVYKTVEQRRIDSEKLKMAGLYEEYSNVNSVERLTVQ